MDKNTKIRTDLLNHLIRKHGLKRYLEIGLQNADQNFNKIECEYKVSVDPDPNAHATFCMTSDKFFDAGLNPRFNNFLLDTKFGIVFIDGLHTSEQVQKDFENALKVLSPNGFIVLHDCNPLEEWHTIVPRPSPTGHWNGDVYKFACELGMYFKKFNVIDIDNGCGVWNNSGADILKDSKEWNGSWTEFNKNREQFLNLISWDEFIAIDSHV